MQYFFTEKSDKDFQANYRYIAHESPNAARSVTDNIESTCNMLAAMLGMEKHT